MKIRVEFNEIEKSVIANAFNCELNEKNDLEEITEAKFGTFHYVPDGIIDIELKSGFISDIAYMITSAVALAKGLIGKWGGESVSKSFKDGVEVVKIYDEKGEDFELVTKEE